MVFQTSGRERGNLHGMEMRAIVMYPNLITKTFHKTITPGITEGGFGPTVLSALTERLNFTINCTKGSKSFTEAVNKTGIGHFDMGVGDFTKTGSREAIVDFSYTLFPLKKSHILQKKHP